MPAVDDLRERTFLVTGASSGIGRALVEALASRGARVVLGARSRERTAPVLDTLRGRHPHADLRFLELDVSDFGSVRRAADRFLAGHGALDVLVNNAGVAGTFGMNADGFDLTYATNHLGPFLLTNLLLPRLRASSSARIVNVASRAQMNIKTIDWSGLERRIAAKRSGFLDYSMTKLMNVLHARELARRLENSSVIACAVHPGVVASEIWRALPRPVGWLIKLFMLSNEQGAETPMFCATSVEPAVVSGAYYDRCREVAASSLADDPALAQELWRRSEAALG